MELRLWIGLHSCLQCFVLVISDASYIIKYMTRFTEEGFSSLISFIFISDAIKKMVGNMLSCEIDELQMFRQTLNLISCLVCFHRLEPWSITQSTVASSPTTSLPISVNASHQTRVSLQTLFLFPFSKVLLENYCCCHRNSKIKYFVHLRY